MSASQHTQNYQLPIYEPDDIPQYLGEEDSWNSTMEKLDTAIAEAAQSGGGGGGGALAQTTGQSTTVAMSQKAVTDQLVGLGQQINNLNIPAVEQTTGDSETATMSQKAITEAISAGGGGGISLPVYKNVTALNPFSTTTQTLLTLDLQPHHLYLLQLNARTNTARTATEYNLHVTCPGVSDTNAYYLNEYVTANGVVDVSGTMIFATGDSGTVTVIYNKDSGSEDTSLVSGFCNYIDLGELPTTD